MRKVCCLALALLGCGCALKDKKVAEKVPLPIASSSNAATVKSAAEVDRAALQSVAEEIRSKPQKQEGEESEADEARFDHPGEAAAFLRSMRTPDGSPVPRERIRAALARARAMQHYSIAEGRFLSPEEVAPRASGNIGTWQSIGPGNIGGRARAMVINPQNPKNMFAGSAVGGGVWVTNDGGQTWLPPTIDVPPNAISSLVMDPNNPKIVYAGAGENFCDANLGCNGDSQLGDGIIKTTDGGLTWSLLPSAASFKVVFKFVFGSKGNLYAGTNSGVWRSTDGGATFTQFANLAGQLCEDLAVRTDITTTETVFASCLNPVVAAGATNPQGAIWRNTDAGGTGQFAQVFTKPLMWTTSIAVAPSLQTTMYALVWQGSTPGNSDGQLMGVFRSTDGGTTWTSQLAANNRLNQALLSYRSSVLADLCYGGKSTLTGGQGYYGNTLAVDPVNANVVWAGGVDTFRSDDGGVNFGVASFWEAGIGNAGYMHADIHSFVFPPGYDGKTNQSMYVMNDGGVFRTDNSRAATVTTAPAACLIGVTPTILWTSLSNATNGWAATEFTNGAVYPGGAAFLGGAQDNGTPRGGFGSAAWIPVSGGDGGFVAVNPLEPNIAYAEYVKDVTYRALDGASFGTLIDLNRNVTGGITESPSNFLFYKHIAIDPNNPATVYIGGKTLWRSTDLGTTWTAASSAFADSVTAITIAPGNSAVMYIGDTAGNVYTNQSTQPALSSTATTAWTQSMPRFGFVSDIQVDPANPMQVYAAYTTYTDLFNPAPAPGGHYVYVSTDGAQTWNPADGSGTTALPGIPVNSLVIDPKNPKTIYAGTDFGVYVTQDGGLTWAKDANPFYNVRIANLALDSGSGVTYLYAFTAGRSAWRTAIPNSGAACTYSVSPTSLAFPPAGGSFSVTVKTSGSCWASAIPTNGNATVLPGAQLATAQNSTLTFTVAMAPNLTGFTINDTVLVQGQPVSVSQPSVATILSAATQNNDLQTAPFTISAVPYAAVVVASGYTSSTSDPVHSCTGSADFNSSWYKVTATQAGEFQIGTFTGVVAAYPAASGAVNLLELACAAGVQGFLNYPTGGSSVSPLRKLFIGSFPITAGTSYLIEVTTQTASQAGADLAIQFVANTVVSVSAPKSSVAPGESLQATASVVGPDNKSVRWTISPPIGNVTQDGVYTAPASLTGSAQVVITATSTLDDGDFGSKTVVVLGASSSPVVATAAGVTNSATNQVSPIAPGEIVTLYGANLGPSQLTTLALGTDGKVATTLGGTQVLFDGIAAPMVYTSGGQAGAVAPFGISGKAMTILQVKNGSSTSDPVFLPVVASAPAIFTADSSGSGPAAVLNQDGTLNSPQNPAPKGSIIVFFATGGGVMNPPQADGEVTSAVAKPVQSVSVTIGGADAPVLYLGAAPTFVAGALQGNVTVPGNAPSGAVPLVLTVGSASSPSNITVYVK